MNNELLKEIDEQLTAQLRADEDYIMERIRILLDEDYYSFQRFNGLFGGKNNTYVDSVRTQFVDFKDFYAQWLKGLIQDYKKRSERYKQPKHSAGLIKYPEIEQYVRVFLKRNFYRNIQKRTREKPNEQLWELWFGYKVVFGLLIAPRYNTYFEKWLIDKSELSKVSYTYWTIGHLFAEGLIDADSSEPIRIENLQQFKYIYSGVLKKLSSSKYEIEFFNRYITYLENSENLNEEPLLIPEVRYGGLERDHKYRLDFTLLNHHVSKYIGVEISPSSTHMKVSKLKEKQKIVNVELSEKWSKEMDKRNAYFDEFGITTITFTDDSLKDIEECWNRIEEKLKERPDEKVDLELQLSEIGQL